MLCPMDQSLSSYTAINYIINEPVSTGTDINPVDNAE